MNRECGCERGDDCTKTTVCALTAVDEQENESDALLDFLRLIEDVLTQAEPEDKVADALSLVAQALALADYHSAEGRRKDISEVAAERAGVDLSMVREACADSRRTCCSSHTPEDCEKYGCTIPDEKGPTP